MEFTPSVLDRLLLIDDKDFHTLEQYSQHDFEDDIRESLERLFNSRCRCGSYDSEFVELKRSLFEYGIFDFTEGGFGGQSDQVEFCRALERTIARCEPRLFQVRVSPLEKNTVDRVFRFRINALIRHSPRPYKVSYTSGLELATYAFEVDSE